MPGIDMVGWLQGRRMEGAVLIILNQPISRPDLFDLAWNSCSFRVVTDGAANHLRALNGSYVPDFIIGDFDSISKESREFFESKKVPFITDEDQYATDFMKAMKQSHQRFDSDGRVPRKFLAFGALGGRVDHTWHSYLCLSIAEQAGDQLVLVSDQNITIGLGSGEYTIATPRNKVGIACGYAPLEGASSVATRGFEWDVEDFDVSFTSRLSTSNYLRSDEVWIKTTKPIMFTVELK